MVFIFLAYFTLYNGLQLGEVLESTPGKYWQTILHLKTDTHFQVSEAFHLFECLFSIKNSIYEPTSLQKMRFKKDSFRKRSIFHVTSDQNVPQNTNLFPVFIIICLFSLIHFFLSIVMFILKNSSLLFGGRVTWSPEILRKIYHSRGTIQKMFSTMSNNIQAGIFPGALFETRDRNQPKCPLIWDWLKKMMTEEYNGVICSHWQEWGKPVCIKVECKPRYNGKHKVKCETFYHCI